MASFEHIQIARGIIRDGVESTWHAIRFHGMQDDFHYIVSQAVCDEGFYGYPDRLPCKLLPTATEAARYAVASSSGIKWTEELLDICDEIDGIDGK